MNSVLLLAHVMSLFCCGYLKEVIKDLSQMDQIVVCLFYNTKLMLK